MPAHRKIESTQNPLIKEALDVKVKRHRYRHEAFLIEGPNLIEGALKRASRAALKRVFFTERFRQHSPALIEGMGKAGTEMFEVTERVIARLSETEAPQGVVAVSSYRPWRLGDLSIKGALVVSDGIQDPGNLGSAIRTADAAGADGVVLLPGTCDPFMPKALRASAGSIFRVPVLYGEREALAGLLRRRKVRLAVTVLDAPESLFEADLRPPIAFVFGNEASGVGADLREAADLRLRIPLRGGAESLNVAASVAVCLYEALRQHSGAKSPSGPP
jgi:TrmH family RNA methyltransferase